MKFRTQVVFIGVVGFAGALVIGATSWFMQKTYDRALEVAELNAQALRNHLEADMMHDALRGDVLKALFVASENKTESFSEVRADYKEHSEWFLEKIESNNSLDLNDTAKRALKEVETPLANYIAAAEIHIEGAFRDLAEEKQKLGEFNDAFSELEESMELVSDRLQAAAEEDVAQAQAQVARAKWIQTLMILLSGAVSFLFAIKVANRVMTQLGGEPTDAVKIAVKIGEGDYSENVSAKTAGKDSLLGQLDVMRAMLDISAREARNNFRIRSALDATSTNVMIANVDRKIIYMNRAIEAMLRANEYELRTALPHFSVDSIVGSSMDLFHANPAHQSRMLENLTSTHVANIKVGKNVFRLMASPIFATDGARLGTVVEWLDRTQEANAETEIGNMVDMAAAGNFTGRIATEDKTGFFLKAAEGLNALVATADRGLNDVARVLSAIAKGDLTERMEGDYSGTFADLKNYCNSTTENLNSMLSDIRSAAEVIFTASSEIAAGNSDLSARTEQQAANLEETASSMEELTSTVKLNADNAKQANVLAERASGVASDGGELIQRVVATMSEINQSSQKIADIIGVIDGIAFQTNILALNAAVEAARAGDQGRGFAVVASEVRTLAQRSANAAKDIKSLIFDSVQRIESGNVLVSKSGDTMKDIVKAIKHVNDIMAEIASASAEQSSGIEGVSNAVSQMDEMTQQSAALVEQAAAAAESLQSQADQLNRSISQFTLLTESHLSNSPLASGAHKSPSVTRPGFEKAKDIKKVSLPKSQQDDEWEQF